MHRGARNRGAPAFFPECVLQLQEGPRRIGVAAFPLLELSPEAACACRLFCRLSCRSSCRSAWLRVGVWAWQRVQEQAGAPALQRAPAVRAWVRPSLLQAQVRRASEQVLQRVLAEQLREPASGRVGSAGLSVLASAEPVPGASVRLVLGEWSRD